MKNKTDRTVFWGTTSFIGMALGLAVCANAVPVEYFYLEGLAEPKRWAPSECELSVSPHKAWERPALAMRIPIDYSTGEKQYPIGWPRMYLTLKKEEQVWYEYDRLEFQILAESSRPALPKRPLIFQVHDQQGQKKLTTLDMAAIGEWRTVQINTRDLGLAGTITRLGFNINEKDYQDKDFVAFHFGGFRLALVTAASVAELSMSAPVIFCDSRVLPLELVVEGPDADLASGIPVQVASQDGIVLTHKVAVSRGRQTVFIPLAGADMSPGKYSATVFPDDRERSKTVAVTLTTTPWR